MARVIIGFSNSFEQDSEVGVSLEGELAEHEQVWLWDHFFSLVMHQLPDEQTATRLLDSLVNWAAGFAPKMLSPVNELHAEGALQIDKKLKLRQASQDLDEFYVVDSQPQPGNWPAVNVKLPEQPTEGRMAYAVIALAQYFLGRNTLFFRELPLHILAMRKFYQEQQPFTSEDSVAGAPAYAFQTAMRFFEDMQAKH